MKNEEPDHMGLSTPTELERLRNEQKSLLDRLDRVGLMLTQEEARAQNAVRTLERLRQEQASLAVDLNLLSDRMAVLQRQFSQGQNAPQIATSGGMPPQNQGTAVPPILPVLEPPPLPLPDSFRRATAEKPVVTPKEPTLQGAHLLDSSAPKPTPQVARGSFEMRLGTYWLVRIGIVMLLSGMVFLGNYAYKNFIGKLGPGGKITLLYFGSALLLVLGKWIGRQQESLKNYAQVLFAGGLAAVYFTTYAAHHVVPLQVIVSPLLDGALLLGWAGFMVWLATRDKSETLALFAVGLGYYTSIITQVGLFTLYSNVILTAAAVFFLLRNRWATLTFGSLAATYAAYGFWRFNHQGAWRWASPAEGLWTGVYFLICYWVIFNAAVFLSRHEHFRGRNRAIFLSLNNGAFFALFLLTMIQVQQGGFWKFAIGYGLVLLGLAVAASRVLKPDRLSPNAYLTQGLLLLTLGFISYYTGLKLGLVLAVESVALFVLSNLLRSRIMFAGALASGGLAALWTLFSLDRGDHTDFYLGCGVSALLMVNNLVKQPQDWPSLKTNNYSRAFFAAAGSLVLFQTTWVFCPVQYRAALLALEGLLLTLSFYAFSAKEFTLTGQLFVVASQVLGLTYLSTRLSGVETSQPWPWWNPLLVGAVTLFLTHWWQRQKRLSMPLRFSQFLQLIYGLTFVGLVYCGLKPHVSAPTWLMLTSALALGLTVYGIITRAWFVACAAQVFLLASSVEFLREIGFSHGYPASGDLQCLVPIGSFLALAWYGKKVLVGGCQAPEDTREGLQVITTFYLWAAFGLSLGWVFEFVPGREWFWVLNLLGAFLFLGGGSAQKRGGLLFGGCYTAVGFLVLWVQFWSESIAYWPNLLGILLLLGEQQLTRRYPARFNVPRSFQWMSIVLGAATLWLLLSKWVMLHAGGFYLTVAWGFLALLLFGTGFLLGERNYRWAGLAILGLALGRVIFFDVWKLETIYRILSFMGLGVVLLVLGFIYNKYQEKLRAWL